MDQAEKIYLDFNFNCVQAFVVICWVPWKYIQWPMHILSFSKGVPINRDFDMFNDTPAPS